MQIRKLQEKDIPALRELLKKGVPFVTAYASYVYWILSRYCESTCFVAVEEERIVGYIGALPSLEKQCVFIWQIVVDTLERGSGIGRALLKRITEAADEMGFHQLEIAISDENISCRKMLSRSLEGVECTITIEGTYEDREFQETIYRIRF